MHATELHDHLVRNAQTLDPHHQDIFSWLQENLQFFIGLENAYLHLRSQLSSFVHTHHQGLVNREFIDDYASKAVFLRLEQKEKGIMKDIQKHRARCAQRTVHDLAILSFLNRLEIQCRNLIKYIRPTLSVADLADLTR